MLGIAQSLSTLTGGELIVPGATVMKIITLVTELIVVMRIATEDIGFIYFGQSTRMKVVVYDYMRCDDIGCETFRMSPSPFNEGKERPTTRRT